MHTYVCILFYLCTQEGGIQYLDLDLQKGPDRCGGGDDVVEYGQAAETKQ